MRYWLDSADRIVRVDDAWLPFAAANGAPELTPDFVRGRPLWGFISDPTTVQLWELILARVRGGAAVAVQIHCDAPDRRRLVRLTPTLDESGLICIASESLAEEPRPAAALLELRRGTRSAELLTSCSWCKRFQLPAGEWVEVEAAVVALGLFEHGAPPAVTHGICARCAARVRDEAGLEPEPRAVEPR